MDFIQEGNELLIRLVYKSNIKAIELFNYNYHIGLERKIIKDFLNVSRHSFDDYCNYIKTCDEFYKNNGREPSFSEIMKLLNISNERATIARNCYQKYQLLDGCLDIEGDLSQYTVEDLVYSKIIRDSIRNMIQSTNLTFREQDIVIKRNGLQNEYYDGFHQPVILEDIASQYNISRQRVDQIYREALRKVKSNPRNIKEVSSR